MQLVVYLLSGKTEKLQSSLGQGGNTLQQPSDEHT